MARAFLQIFAVPVAILPEAVVFGILLVVLNDAFEDEVRVMSGHRARFGRWRKEQPNLAADAQAIDADDVCLFEEGDRLLNLGLLGIFAGSQQGVSGQRAETAPAIPLHL